jgi:cytochrome P450
MQPLTTMEYVFPPTHVREPNPYGESLAYRLLDDFIGDGRCEFVSQFKVPLPLYADCAAVGVADSDMPEIKTWTGAWIKRMVVMLNRKERIWSAEQGIKPHR